MDNTMCFHPDLLPESADPAGSERFSDIQIVRLEIPCREYGVFEQLHTNLFVIYVCSPEFTETKYDYFKGTVLKEINGFSWWRSIA